MIALMVHDRAVHHHLLNLLSDHYDLIIPRRLEEPDPLLEQRCRLALVDSTLLLEWRRADRSPYPGAGLQVLALVEAAHLDQVAHPLLQGVDDFVVRPFRDGELLQRVARLLQTPAEGAEQYQVGPFRLDLRTGEACHEGRRLPLTRKEAALLYALARRAGRTVTRDDLLNEVWGTDTESSSNVLDVCIRSLRRKIEPEAQRPRYIQTVRGVGYRLLIGTGEPGELPAG